MVFSHIAIGDELLDGRYRDAHAQTLGGALTRRGLRLERTIVVRDGDAAIRDALDRSRDHDVIVVTGGLGATDDDLTRDVVASWIGRALEVDATSLSRVRERLGARGYPFKEFHSVHATVPQGATVIQNPVGLAAGFVCELEGGGLIAVLPGVPREMNAMVEATLDVVAPIGAAWHQRRFLTYGIPEKTIERRLAASATIAASVHLGITPRGGPVDLTVNGSDEGAVDATASSIEAALGDVIVTRDGTSIAKRVGELLGERGETVSSAESCTGGLISSMITDVGGSSGYFKESVVTYSNEAKIARLGVRSSTLSAHGAVSEETVREMAIGARDRSGADWALAVSGIAGPGGGSAEKPVGTVHVALASADRVDHDCFGLFGLPRSEVKRRTALGALVMLIRALERLE